MEIAILAMIAAFLALRLYSVLGKRTGHEQPLAPVEERPSPIAQAAQPLKAAPTPAPADTVYEAGAADGVRAIIAAEPQFDVARFLEGAKAAYRMVLEAFWRGDEAELAGLTNPTVRDAFAAAIAERRAAGHQVDNRLISVEKATISDAELQGRVARITVQFDADIAAVTRDAEGRVIAGSMTDAVLTHDVWTFERTLRTDDPNWILVDTDARD